MAAKATRNQRTTGGRGAGPKRRPARAKPAVEALEARCLLSGSYRTIDGTGNNLDHPTWGSAGVDLLRVAPAAYADGVSAPAGASRPGPRDISNAIVAQSGDIINNRFLSDYVYVWGQFLDHDLDLTPNGTPAEPLPIPVPSGDPFFDPTGTGTQTIAFNRSQYDPATGTSTRNPRQQPNVITAWIDASQVYGSDPTRAAALRTFVGGKLKTSAGNLLPFNTAGLPNANDAHIVPDDQLFLAGDVRANENIELSAMHTLFMREHNRLADQIAAANPGLSDEEIYQRARRIVGAEMQVITYNEFLPALLGGRLPAYRGYNPNVNPGIATEFSTAAFRFGHSMLDGTIDRLDNNGNDIPEGPAALRNAFFNPTLFDPTLPNHEGDIDPILKGAASGDAQEIDNKLVDDVRNFLFGPPGSGGFDLASLNIQRGRDHGLADYNRVRVAYGLPAARSFADITSDPTLQAKLQALYGNVNNIDLWVGGLAEDHVPGASVGPLIRRILVDQFTRLRDGDRYWYQRIFSGSQLNALENTRLSDIIRRNTSITNLQSNVFIFQVTIRGRVFNDANGNGFRDTGEGGLAGVTVQLEDTLGNVLLTTQTASDGSYQFTGLALGTYRVRVVPPAGDVQTTSDPADIQVTQGTTIGGVNFGLHQTGLTAQALTSSAAKTAAAPSWDSSWSWAALQLADPGAQAKL